MALYPSYESIPYDDLTITPNFRTVSANFEEFGKKRRKRKWLFTKRNISMVYNHLSKIEARSLWQLFLNAQGSFGTFSWFNNEIDTYTKEYIGTGDGTTTVWNLPCKTPTSVTVYLDNVELINITDYTIVDEAGADGAAAITLVVAPEAGAYLTIDFTGYLKVNCSFSEDNIDLKYLQQSKKNITINLEGNLNE
jgi:hypothetical protein